MEEVKDVAVAFVTVGLSNGARVRSACLPRTKPNWIRRKPGDVAPQARVRPKRTVVTVEMGAKAYRNDEGVRESDFERWLYERVKPAAVSVPRARLAMPFAVGLMRSSYEVTDELDIVPMNAFQRDFFLLRSDHYEQYLRENRVALQGDLTDPSYFDFISFAQYATISREIKQGATRLMFEEQYNAEGDTRVIRRDPQLNSVASLVSAFNAGVGTRILDRILADAGEPPKFKAVSKADEVVALVQWMTKIFERGGYALQSSVSRVESANSSSSGNGSDFAFEVVWTAPATLWSEQWLRRRREVVVNDHDAKTLQALLSKAVPGLHITKCDISFTQSTITRRYSIAYEV